MEEKIYKELLKECNKSLKSDDVPVGAVLVYNNKIISKGHNTRESKDTILNHAEINCILKANRKLKRWHLEDCVLYVTLKPCSMCQNIIKQSRINKVIYYVDKPESKKEYNKVRIIQEKTDYSQKYKEMLTNFFKSKRKR